MSLCLQIGHFADSRCVATPVSWIETFDSDTLTVSSELVIEGECIGNSDDERLWLINYIAEAVATDRSSYGILAFDGTNWSPTPVCMSPDVYNVVEPYVDDFTIPDFSVDPVEPATFSLTIKGTRSVNRTTFNLPTNPVSRSITYSFDEVDGDPGETLHYNLFHNSTAIECSYTGTISYLSKYWPQSLPGLFPSITHTPENTISLISSDYIAGTNWIHKTYSVSQTHGIDADPTSMQLVSVLQISLLFSSGNIETPTPTVSTPVFAQVHVLAGEDIITPAPTLDTPTLSQLHVLTGSDLITPSPTLSIPTLSVSTTLNQESEAIGYAHADDNGAGTNTDTYNSGSMLIGYDDAPSVPDVPPSLYAGLIRFPAAGIPNGATITTATLTVKIATGVYGSKTVTMRWFGDEAGTPSNPADYTAHAALTRTTAYADDTYSSTTGDYTLDVTSIVQELVNLAGWTTSSKIQLLADYLSKTGTGFPQGYFAIGSTTLTDHTLDIEYTA